MRLLPEVAGNPPGNTRTEMKGGGDVKAPQCPSLAGRGLSKGKLLHGGFFLIREPIGDGQILGKKEPY